MQAMKRSITGGLLILFLAACRGAEPTSIERDVFVATVVELRQAAMETRNEPGLWEARKAQVLQRHGVTESDLQAYVEVRGTDVEHMAEVWNAINSELAERGLTHVQ